MSIFDFLVGFLPRPTRDNHLERLLDSLRADPVVHLMIEKHLMWETTEDREEQEFLSCQITAHLRELAVTYQTDVATICAVLTFL
jgi:hypothetical protein